MGAICRIEHVCAPYRSGSAPFYARGKNYEMKLISVTHSWHERLFGDDRYRDLEQAERSS